MNVTIIGTGYVGLTTAAFLSSLNHVVYCVDKDADKVDQLLNGNIPIYEPGLEPILKKNKEKLSFTTNLNEAISSSSVIMITVGTPSLQDGSTDLSFIDTVIHELASCISSYKTIVIKSTVPPGTNKRVRKRLESEGVSTSLFNVVSNPEFLREGTAVYDMFHPDRTVIGVDENDTKSLSVMKELYKGFHDSFNLTSLGGAELIKYASNTFLAAKISFVNELARICDSYEVDVMDVVKGMGSDPRIGNQFLQPGIGYGGSCFPKDVSSLHHSAKVKQINTPILRAIQTINHSQVDYFVKKIQSKLPNPEYTKIAVLGIAFKPNTDDTRYSKAIALIEQLAELGYTVHTYDPQADYTFSKTNIVKSETIERVLQDVDATVVATDWNQFKELNWENVKDKMKGNMIFDGRNCLHPKDIQQAGLKYYGVGRS